MSERNLPPIGSEWVDMESGDVGRVSSYRTKVTLEGIASGIPGEVFRRWEEDFGGRLQPKGVESQKWLRLRAKIATMIIEASVNNLRPADLAIDILKAVRESDAEVEVANG